MVGRGGKATIRAAAARAAELLKDALDNDTLTAQQRVAVAQDILDRVYGRPAPMAKPDDAGKKIVIALSDEAKEYGE